MKTTAYKQKKIEWGRDSKGLRQILSLSLSGLLFPHANGNVTSHLPKLGDSQKPPLTALLKAKSTREADCLMNGIVKEFWMLVKVYWSRDWTMFTWSKAQLIPGTPVRQEISNS